MFLYPFFIPFVYLLEVAGSKCIHCLASVYTVQQVYTLSSTYNVQNSDVSCTIGVDFALGVFLKTGQNEGCSL